MNSPVIAKAMLDVPSPSVGETPVKPGQARLAKQALAMDSASLEFDAGPSIRQYPWLRNADADTEG